MDSRTDVGHFPRIRLELKHFLEDSGDLPQEPLIDSEGGGRVGHNDNVSVLQP